jgi:hypothetical protein
MNCHHFFRKLKALDLMAEVHGVEEALPFHEYVPFQHPYTMGIISHI